MAGEGGGTRMAGEGERGGEAELARRSEPAWPDPALATRRPALEEKPPGDMANGEVGGRRRRREAGGADEVGEGERETGERGRALGIKK